MKTRTHYVGIDVSKLSFDVSIENGNSHKHCQLSNDSQGFKSLVGLLHPDNTYHVVMEASGPYYLRLATFLFEQNVNVSVVNPLVIRRFCQMRLCRTKTDKKDAYMILLYGQSEQPSLWKPDATYVLELRQMQATVEGLNQSRTDMVRQREAFMQSTAISKDAINALDTAITVLDQQIALLDDHMLEVTQQHHTDMFKCLQSIPGVGKKTAMQLITTTGAFTKFSNAKQLSSYFGLSPRIYQSGSSVKGKARITKMGMGRIRAILYLCAWSAKRWNKACRELYERLIQKGKSKRLALVAVANKLLKQAFAIATKGVLYLQ